MNYAQACAQYEARRRAANTHTRVVLLPLSDGRGYAVGDACWGDAYAKIRWTAGNVYGFRDPSAEPTGAK
jgi:hypothetical protein